MAVGVLVGQRDRKPSSGGGVSLPWRDMVTGVASGLTPALGALTSRILGSSGGGYTNPPPSTGRNLGGDRGWQPKPQGSYAPLPPQVRAPRVGVSRMSAPPRPRMPDYSAVTSALASSQQQAVDSLASLEGQYRSQLAALRDQYRLAETPEEKSQIQFALKNLEAQRAAGQQVVKKAYGAAVKGSKKSAKQTRKAGKKAGKRAQKQFSKAAAEARDLIEAQEAGYADDGLGLGAGGLSGQAAEIAADTARAGAREARFAENMDRASANEMRYLGESMRGESAAQQSELSRIAAALSARAQMEHDAQVNARIQAERMALAQAQQGLSGMFTQRAFGLQDTLQGIGAQGASLLAQMADNRSGLFNDWRNQVWATRGGNQQAAVDAANQRRQQQFDLDSARQASIYQQTLDEYLRKQQAAAQPSLSALLGSISAQR